MDLFARLTFIHLTELSIILKNVTSVVTLHFLICFIFIIFFYLQSDTKKCFLIHSKPHVHLLLSKHLGHIDELFMRVQFCSQR